MTINLKPEQERIIQRRSRAVTFQSRRGARSRLGRSARKGTKPKATTPRKNLAQFLMESPLAGAELNLERQKDYGRPG